MFESIDLEGNGFVSSEEWSEYIYDRHSEMRADASGSGDAWLCSFLHSLETGCDEFDLAHAQETEEESAAREGPTEEMLNLARTVHERITGISGTSGEGMSHDGFARAEAGKTAIYREIGAAKNGVVTMETWIEYVVSTHSRKRKVSLCRLQSRSLL